MNSVKVRLNLYILAIVLLCTLLISGVSLINSKKLVRAQIEVEKGHLTNQIINELNHYQNTIDIIEHQIDSWIKPLIIDQANQIFFTYENPKDVPISKLSTIAKKVGMDHVFLIDSFAVIQNTTLIKELNYDLKNEGEEFYEFFKELFSINEFQIYSWGVSSVDNELTIYCYYVPEGATYMLETSIALKNYLEINSVKYFENGGLLKIKDDIPLHSNMIATVDLFNMNDAYNASILRKNMQLGLSESELINLRKNRSLVIETELGENYYVLISMDDNEIRLLPDLILKAEFNYSEQEIFIKQILWLNLIALLVVLLLASISSPILMDKIIISKIQTINYNLNALRFAKYNDLNRVSGVDELATIDNNIHHVKNAFIEREKQLNDAKVLAESADKLKTAFLANMSHEIRTPLNAVVGFAQLLRDASPSPEDTERFTGLINTNSQKLLQLINDIIDLAHIESGQLKMVQRPVCLHELLGELYGYAKSKLHGESLIFNDKSIQIILDTDTREKGSCIISDGHRLRQIMQQLIDNAVKFTCKGSIHLGYKIDNGQIDFYVSDTGIGIDENDVSKIFDRFVQAEDYLSREFGGTGLGLAICYELAKLLNGTINVSSILNKGSTFSLILPYIKSEKNS